MRMGNILPCPLWRLALGPQGTPNHNLDLSDNHHGHKAPPATLTVPLPAPVPAIPQSGPSASRSAYASGNPETFAFGDISSLPGHGRIVLGMITTADPSSSA
jgi:hypothetical protein